MVNSSLAQALKSRTSAQHRAAERAGVMRDLLHGRIDRRAYCHLLRNLYELYSALESALTRHCTHPCVQPVFLPQLFRTDALAADLHQLHGNRWIDELEVMNGTERYVGRLSEIATTRPELLVAHAYVRYLGDLSGGQILRRIVRDSLQLSPPAGMRFLDFGEPEQVETMVHRFRVALDSINVGSRASADIVAEAQLSFEMHTTLFEELAAARQLPGSIVDRERSHLPV